jgi:O-antigen ligase
VTDATIAAPPRWARRVADGCLWFTAATIPLSTTGMQLGVAGLAVLSVASAIQGWGIVRRTPLDGVIGFFFACCAVSTLASGHPLEAIGWIKLWTTGSFFVVYWWLEGARGGNRFMRTLAVAGGVAGLYGIVQHFTGIDWYREMLGRPRRVRPRTPSDPRFAVVGFFRNYLTFAHNMVMPYCAALALGLRGDGGWLVAALVILTAILYSTARGAWLAVVAASILIVAFGRGRRAAAVALALASVVAVTVGQSAALQRGVGSMFALDGENVGRVAIYRVNLDIIHDHPWFGLGFGRYQTAARPYYREAAKADRHSHAHNNFLHIAAEAGLITVGAFALLFAFILRLGWDAVRGGDPRARLAAVGAYGAVIGFLVGGLTQYTFGDSEVVLAMWCVVAVLMRCRPQEA